MAVLTQELVKKVFIYNTATGVFTWRTKMHSQAVVGSVAGSLKPHGYIAIQFARKRYYAHQLAFLYMIGRIPEQVDHINNIRSDNRWENLREVTVGQNRHNSLLSSKNTSGVKGVSWDSRRNNYLASVKLNNKAHYVGRFTNLEEAEKAVNTKREELHKEYANVGK